MEVFVMIEVCSGMRDFAISRQLFSGCKRVFVRAHKSKGNHTMVSSSSAFRRHWWMPATVNLGIDGQESTWSFRKPMSQPHANKGLELYNLISLAAAPHVCARLAEGWGRSHAERSKCEDE
jgi:hypothetical protein